MGGNALKYCKTRRYQKDEFDVIIQIIKGKLLTFFERVDMPKYFKNKPSFGDADFLCLIPDKFNINLKQWIIDEFQSKEVFINGGVYSFEYNELQVDVILSTKLHYETYLNYLCWNDLNNLVGKISRRLGLSWGQEGLFYKYYSDGKLLGEIIVSKFHIESLYFLGFDALRYEDGFDSLDEIFDFVTSSKYFCPWIYDLENLNKTNRDRDKKRATYNAFIEHIKPLKDKGEDAYHYFYPDKKVYLGMIDAYFPGFLKEYRALEIKEERIHKIASLFNGDIVMQHFDLSGVELGEAMKKFKNEYNDDKEQFGDWILEQNDTRSILQRFAAVNDLDLDKYR